MSKQRYLEKKPLKGWKIWSMQDVEVVWIRQSCKFNCRVQWLNCGCSLLPIKNRKFSKRCPRIQSSDFNLHLKFKDLELALVKLNTHPLFLLSNLFQALVLLKSLLSPVYLLPHEYVVQTLLSLLYLDFLDIQHLHLSWDDHIEEISRVPLSEQNCLRPYMGVLEDWDDSSHGELVKRVDVKLLS